MRKEAVLLRMPLQSITSPFLNSVAILCAHSLYRFQSSSLTQHKKDESDKQ